MARQPVTALWRHRLTDFVNNRSGATAVITGVMILLLSALGFAAFDYTRVMGSRTQLQDALDAATLAAARIRSDDPSVIVKAGEDHLAALVSTTEFNNLDADFFPGEKSVRSTATASIQPHFIHMFMGGPVPIAVNSEVVRGLDGSLEVALVLDTTESMSFFGKIGALKIAGRALVDKVTEVEDADVKIAVVPFADYVNIGVSRRNEPWADVPADYSATSPATPRTCETRTTTTTCQRETYTCSKDGVMVPNGCSRNINCQTQTVAPYEVCWGGGGPSTSHYRFRGCVGSPQYPKNVTDNDPTRKYPGFLNVSCTNELTPLSNDYNRVKAAIASLSPANNTYIPSGLAWGFNLLSKPVPFTEGADYDPNNKMPRKALVLMTDGANTLRLRANGTHGDFSPSQAVTDAHTLELCQNIKAAKIDVYTVAFQIDNAAADKLLQDCATSPGHYYKADSAAELLKAFEDIAASLENLRITR